MNKNEYQNLLKTIVEAYNPDSDPRNAFIDRSKLKPWERLVGGDIHDIPGGEEAWKKQQAEKETKAKEAEAAKPKQLPVPDSVDDTWDAHLTDNKFGISPEAHEVAKKLMGDLKNAYSYDYPIRLEDLHDHLRKSGVSVSHPHMKAIMRQSQDAQDMNDEKARSRAGY